MGTEERSFSESESCKAVRQAILSKELNDADISAHLSECAACQKFQTECAEMFHALSLLNQETLDKHGVSVREAVMEEVERRAVFGKTQGVGHRLYRHIGLAAACIVICVLAFPFVMNGLYPAKSADTAEFAYDNGAYHSNNATPMAIEKAADQEAAEESPFDRSESTDIPESEENQKNKFPQAEVKTEAAFDTASTNSPTESGSTLLYSALIAPLAQLEMPESDTDSSDALTQDSVSGSGNNDSNSLFYTQIQADTLPEHAFYVLIQNYGELQREDLECFKLSDNAYSVTFTAGSGEQITVHLEQDIAGTWTLVSDN